VVDRLEGPHLAQAQALHLVRITLRRGQFGLCAEILRFMMPPGFKIRGPDRSGSRRQAVTIGGAGGGKGRRLGCGPSQQPKQDKPSTGGSWLGWLWGGGGGGGGGADAVQGKMPAVRTSVEGRDSFDDGSSPWRGSGNRMSATGAYRQSLASALQSAGSGGGAGSGSSGGAWEGLSAGSASGAEEACHMVSDHAWLMLEQVGTCVCVCVCVRACGWLCVGGRLHVLIDCRSPPAF